MSATNAARMNLEWSGVAGLQAGLPRIHMVMATGMGTITRIIMVMPPSGRG